jgi:hypothetical protein
MTLMNVLKNPLIIGALIGAVFKILHIPVPSLALNTIQSFNRMTTPLSLFVLGGCFNYTSLADNKKLLGIYTMLKMIIIPVIVLGAAVMIGYRGDELVTLLVLFGTAMSSLVCYFLSSQGQISAVGSIVSSCYGFLCGAYMPLSQFGEGLREVLSYLPFTYATSLLRRHTMRGAFVALEDHFTSLHYPEAAEQALLEAVDGMRRTTDCVVYFKGEAVSEGAMLLYLIGATALFMAAYLLIHLIHQKRARRA